MKINREDLINYLCAKDIPECECTIREFCEMCLNPRSAFDCATSFDNVEDMINWLNNSTEFEMAENANDHYNDEFHEYRFSNNEGYIEGFPFPKYKRKH